MRRTLSLTLGLLTAVSACGGKKKKDKLPADPNHQAEMQLVDADRVRFEAWKTKLVKDCDVTTIFPESGEAPAGSAIDGRVFLEKAGGSLKLKNASGAFAIMDSPRSPAGYSESRVERELNVNGAGYRLEAAARRSDSLCEIFLFGKKVFETRVYAEMPVAIYGEPGAKGAKTTNVKPVVSRVHSSDALAQMTEPRFVDALWINSQTTGKTPEFFASYFELSVEDAKKFFPSDQIYQGPHSIVVPSLPKILPFANKHVRLYGDEASLVALKDKAGTLVVRLAPFNIFLDGKTTVNTADSNVNWVLHANLSATAGADGYITYGLNSLTLENDLPLDNAAATECFTRRAKTLSSLTFGTANYQLPSFSESASACGMLAKSFSDAVLADPTAKTLTMNFVTIDKPASHGNYGGWSAFFKDLIVAIVEKDENIVAVLNSEGKYPLVDQVAAAVEELRGALADHPVMNSERPAFVRMVSQWKIAGMNVADGFSREVVASLANAVEIFPASTNRVISELTGTDPNTQKDALAFAAGLTAEYKAAAQQLKATAEEMEMTALLGDIFSTILQKRPTIETLRSMQANLATAAAFMERENIRMRNETFSSVDKVKKVVTVGFNEGWSADDYVAFESLMPLGQLDMFCESKKSASAVADCVGLGKYSKKTDMLFDPRYKGRYATFVPKMVAMINSLGNEPFLGKDLRKAFFEPIWKKCDNTQFATNSYKLKALVDKYSGLSDFETDKQIDALLAECR